MGEAEDLGVDMLGVLALDEPCLNLSHDSGVVFEDCNRLGGGGEAGLIFDKFVGGVEPDRFLGRRMESKKLGVVGGGCRYRLLDRFPTYRCVVVEEQVTCLGPAGDHI